MMVTFKKYLRDSQKWAASLLIPINDAHRHSFRTLKSTKNKSHWLSGSAGTVERTKSCTLNLLFNIVNKEVKLLSKNFHRFI